MAGQIIKKAENKYLVRAFQGRDPITGKRKYHGKVIRGTRKDAQRYLNGVLREIDMGTFVAPSNMTVNIYLDHWLEHSAKPRVSRRTADGYTHLLKRYIREPLGGLPLSQVKPMDIQKVYAEMQGRGLCALMVRHVHSVFRGALQQAMKWGMLARNPAALVELPKVEHKERRVLSADEAMRFLAKAAEMPRGLIFEFALLTGMRPEEFLAVQWSDIDFSRCVVIVQRALVWHRKVWSFEETKTSKSRRTIPMPAELLKKLAAHKRTQAEARLRIGHLWQNHNLVFCSEIGTPLSLPGLTYRYFRPILVKAELPQIRVYDLRHSHATLLLAADENPKVVAERLGHSTVRLTLDTYSHVLPTMQERATEKLGRMLYNAG